MELFLFTFKNLSQRRNILKVKIKNEIDKSLWTHYVSFTYKVIFSCALKPISNTELFPSVSQHNQKFEIVWGKCGRVTRWRFLNQSDAVVRKVLSSEPSRGNHHSQI